MRLNKPEGIDFSGGKLTVKYMDGSDTSSEVFAVGELSLD
jgi:hypothetical protein